MPTNAELTGQGTTGKQGDADFQDFSVKYQGYTEDETGAKNILADYGPAGLSKLVNGVRSVSAVNGERTRLTAGKREAKNTKANIYDEIEAAETQEEKMAIMKRAGLLG